MRPALVFGLDRAGLALVRALGRTGVPVTGIAWHPHDFGVRSRYLADRRFVAEGDPARRADEVLAVAAGLAKAERPVVLPDGDESIDTLLRRWDEFRALADMPLPEDAEVVRRLRRKELLPRVALEAGVPAPATAHARDEESIRAAGLRPPLLIKPVEGKEFEFAFYEKAFLATDVDAAVSAWRRADAAGFETIVQELIPDAADRIYSLFTYVGRDGEPLASVVGRKVRQLPIPFGSSTAFEVRWEPPVFELGARLLRSVGYRGLAHVEFAFDRRDGQFKLLEVNTRVPVWGALAMGSELNIARVAYDDLVGAPPPEPRVLTKPTSWVDLTRDLIHLGYRRDPRLHRFVAPYLRRRKVRAVFARDDPAPTLGLLSLVRERAAARLRGRSA